MNSGIGRSCEGLGPNPLTEPSKGGCTPVCVPISRVAGAAVTLQFFMTTRAFFICLEGHDGINLHQREGTQSQQQTLASWGRSKNIADALTLRSK